MLEPLGDEDLKEVIARAEQLLKERDADRKDKALVEARTSAKAILEAAGLSLDDLNRRLRKPAKGPSYHAGRQYQHPTNKVLTWNAKGQKPRWLREIEAQGGKAIELP